MKIEESEDEEKEKKGNKEKKELIYDNTYLFKKNKKVKNIAIKKEVLDILQSKNNSSTKKEKENNIINNYLAIRLSKRRPRKINYKFLKK